MSIANFAILGELGRGAYSQVYKARRIADGKIYALKKVEIDKLSAKERDNALCEISIISQVRHNNVVTYHESFKNSEDKTLMVVMDFADDGDLHHKVRENHEKQ